MLCREIPLLDGNDAVLLVAQRPLLARSHGFLRDACSSNLTR